MEITQHHLPVQKTARYFSSGASTIKIKNLWIVLHGYSQQAQEFIKHFESIAGSNTLIIAPEGLSRFYVRGYFGNVGASWMTKEDRMNDIIDNVNFLDLLLKKVLDEMGYTPEKINVLGFSQGGATAARWVSVTNHTITGLVIYASEFPKDIGDDALLHLNKKVKTCYVYSNHDDFIDEDLFNEQFIYLNEKNFTFEKVFFDGKHEIKQDVLVRLANLLTDSK